MTLRICLVTTFYPPFHFGGDAVAVRSMAEALARHGHQVEVVHNRNAYRSLARGVDAAPDPEANGLVITHPLDGPGGLDLLALQQFGRPVAFARALRCILQRDWDVIHFNNVSLMGAPQIFSQGNAVKIMTLHEYWLICGMHVLWRYGREACQERTCFRCMLAGGRPPQLWRRGGAVRPDDLAPLDALLAPSRFTRTMHRHFYPDIEIRHLPHFSSPSVLSSEGSAPPERPYFIYAGRLEELKGIGWLVDRFLEYHDADLIIAGKGSLEAALRSRASRASHIRFLGAVHRPRLASLYRQALAAIVPSLCYETFGLVPIEAFAEGTPAIVRQIGALPELVESGAGLAFGDDGQFFEALRTMQNASMRRPMSEKASALAASEYSEGVFVKRYEAIVDELKARRPGSAG